MFNIFKKNKITEDDINSLSDEIVYLKHEREYFKLVDEKYPDQLNIKMINKLNNEIINKENIFNKIVSDYQNEVNE